MRVKLAGKRERKKSGAITWRRGSGWRSGRSPRKRGGRACGGKYRRCRSIGSDTTSPPAALLPSAAPPLLPPPSASEKSPSLCVSRWARRACSPAKVSPFYPIQMLPWRQTKDLTTNCPHTNGLYPISWTLGSLIFGTRTPGWPSPKSIYKLNPIYRVQS